MLGYVSGSVIFIWKPISSVIMHYNLTEPGQRWVPDLVFMKTSLRRCMSVLFLIWQLLGGRSHEGADEGMSDADSCQKSVFPARSDKRHVTWKLHQTKYLWDAAKPGGFLSSHRGLGWLTRIAVVTVGVWEHCHLNCSRHQSTSASSVQMQSQIFFFCQSLSVTQLVCSTQ